MLSFEIGGMYSFLLSNKCHSEPLSCPFNILQTREFKPLNINQCSKFVFSNAFKNKYSKAIRFKIYLARYESANDQSTKNFFYKSVTSM